MQEILNQLGDLMLGSLPTVVFFLILLAAYAVLVRKPLEKILADRHGRTGGAMDEARAAITAAEEKAAHYEARLRAARAEIFDARAARQKAAGDAREKMLAETREQAGRRVAAAREQVERAGTEARAQIEVGAASLSRQVLAAILPNRTGVAQ
jgi:F-type H+-transporting ATPase subunit b